MRGRTLLNETSYEEWLKWREEYFKTGDIAMGKGRDKPKREKKKPKKEKGKKKKRGK